MTFDQSDINKLEKIERQILTKNRPTKSDNEWKLRKKYELYLKIDTLLDAIKKIYILSLYGNLSRINNNWLTNKIF